MAVGQNLIADNATGLTMLLARCALTMLLGFTPLVGDEACSADLQAVAVPAAGLPPPPEPKPLTRPDERDLRPGFEFRECGDCPSMVVAPAGDFLMGASDDEDGRTSSETPRHRVAIARDFAVGRFAVTVREWRACVADRSCRALGYGESSEDGQPDDMPARGLSWLDAKGYAFWLARRTNRPYRLLSEAEREYVARAGAETPFWWGASVTREQANFDFRLTRNGAAKRDEAAGPVPVGQFKPNPWGLYQVHGNVSEWVEDCWNGDYEGAPLDGSAWLTGDCDRHVLRGGGWSRSAFALRAAARLGVGDALMHYFGLRVARDLRR